MANVNLSNKGLQNLQAGKQLQQKGKELEKFDAVKVFEEFNKKGGDLEELKELLTKNKVKFTVKEYGKDLEQVIAEVNGRTLTATGPSNAHQIPNIPQYRSEYTTEHTQVRNTYITYEINGNHRDNYAVQNVPVGVVNSFDQIFTSNKQNYISTINNRLANGQPTYDIVSFVEYGCIVMDFQATPVCNEQGCGWSDITITDINYEITDFTDNGDGTVSNVQIEFTFDYTVTHHEEWEPGDRYTDENGVVWERTQNGGWHDTGERVDPNDNGGNNGGYGIDDPIPTRGGLTMDDYAKQYGLHIHMPHINKLDKQ